MKLNNIFKAIAGIAVSAFMLVSCEQEKLVKPNALLSESSLEFEAIGAEPQLLTIASDEEWMVDAPEWITVDPLQGSNTMKVTVSVTDNVDKNGIKAAPRDGIITIALTRNNYSIEVLVRQKGDKYLNAADYTVSEAAALTDEVAVKIPEAGVMAATASAFVISDGSANMYVKGANTVKAGDKIALNGSISTKEGVPALIVDEVEVKGNEELSYPEPEDINGKLGDYKPAAVNYVTVDGTVLGASLISGTASATLVESEVLEEVNTHKATLCAYYVGNATYLVVSAKDNGADENVGTPLPFVEDFSWLEPYVAAYNATNPSGGPVSDCVAGSIASADGAVNVYSNAVMTAANPVTGLSFMDDFHARGYTDINGEKTSMYLQDMYLKFGKTGAGNRQALGLPRFRIDGTDNVVVSWDYCAQLQGDGTPDKVMLVLEITGPGKVTNPASKEEVDNKEKRSDIIAVNQEKSECHWQRASVTVEGVTTATTFSIVPSNWKETNAHRFYIDNISVMLESQAVPATITITGLNNNSVLFKGVPEGPVSFDVVSDKFYTITTSDNWVHVSETGGEAGEKKTVEITCDASSLSEPREAKIVVTSGITTEEIVVYQSAAGQQLMTSVALDKSRVTVLGEGESFEINTQYTDPYEVNIEADWISELTTRNLAEFGHHTFIAKPNTTGAARTGSVIFSIPGTTAEAILLVTQENFEPRIDVVYDKQIVGFIPVEGKTIPVQIVSNIDFTVTSDDVVLPVSEAVAGTYDLDVEIKANTGLSRDVKATFRNEKYDYTYVFSINQLGSEVIFAEDFNWLDPWSVAGDGKGQTAGRTVETGDLGAYAPQLPTPKVDGVSALQALESKGYEFTRWNKGTLTTSECIYLQQNYLKVGKTGYHAAIKLPSMAASTQTAALTFDWCPMKQGSGKVDPVNLLVVVENGSESTTFTVPTHGWENNHALEWIPATINLSGVVITETTRITIRQTDEENNAGTANRWFIDNIKVMVL
ncbi:MAG: BACON domain-containing protein [Candidatus Cryptobacteroides sp.]